MNKHPITEHDHNKLLVAPSVLASDFANLTGEIKRVEEAGADVLHLDIMDGHFVPNLTIGPPVVKSIRKVTAMTFDVHLMLTNPLKYSEPFAKSGADHITFHLECDDDNDETITAIRNLDCSVGMSVKPKTPASEIIPWLPKLDLVLVMTVEPGFGGQSFMSDMMPKVREIRQAINEQALPVHLEVDGGVDPETVKTVAAAGANLIVAGTSVFRNPKGAEFAISSLHAAQQELDETLP